MSCLGPSTCPETHLDEELSTEHGLVGRQTGYDGWCDGGRPRVLGRAGVKRQAGAICCFREKRKRTDTSIHHAVLH